MCIFCNVGISFFSTRCFFGVYAVIFQVIIVFCDYVSITVDNFRVTFVWLFAKGLILATYNYIKTSSVSFSTENMCNMFRFHEARPWSSPFHCRMLSHVPFSLHLLQCKTWKLCMPSLQSKMEDRKSVV